LVLRWLCAHMLSEHFTEESIELLVAYLFTNPRPYELPPSNHLIGFWRFLDFLSYYDFRHNPVIVDFENQLTLDDRIAIGKSFISSRSSHPKEYAIFIATAQDRLSYLWTKEKPTNLILERVISLARQSDRLLQERFRLGKMAGKDPSLLDPICKLLFVTPLEDYDLLIKLKPGEIPNYEQSIQLVLAKESESSKSSSTSSKESISLNDNDKRIYRMKSKKRSLGLDDHPSTTPNIGTGNLELTKRTGSLLIGFNPVKLYLKELQERFGDKALFFYDSLGGSLIGIVWKPTSFLPRMEEHSPLLEKSFPYSISISLPHKVGTSIKSKSSKQPANENAHTYFIVDIIEVVRDIYRVGEGLVESVEVCGVTGNKKTK